MIQVLIQTWDIVLPEGKQWPVLTIVDDDKMNSPATQIKRKDVAVALEFGWVVKVVPVVVWYLWNLSSAKRREP